MVECLPDADIRERSRQRATAIHEVDPDHELRRRDDGETRVGSRCHGGCVAMRGVHLARPHRLDHRRRIGDDPHHDLVPMDAAGIPVVRIGNEDVGVEGNGLVRHEHVRPGTGRTEIERLRRAEGGRADDVADAETLSEGEVQTGVGLAELYHQRQRARGLYVRHPGQQLRQRRGLRSHIVEVGFHRFSVEVGAVAELDPLAQGELVAHVLVVGVAEVHRQVRREHAVGLQDQKRVVGPVIEGAVGRITDARIKARRRTVGPERERPAAFRL